MMTVEHRVIIALDDVQRIGLECKKCHRRMTLAPDDDFLAHPADALTCPFCRHLWIDASPTQGIFTNNPFAKLLASLGPCRSKQQSDAIGVLISLQIDEAAVLDDLNRRRM